MSWIFGLSVREKSYHTNKYPNYRELNIARCDLGGTRSGNGPHAGTHIYNGTTQSFVPGPDLPFTRTNCCMVKLSDTQSLLSGGNGGGGGIGDPLVINYCIFTKLNGGNLTNLKSYCHNSRNNFGCTAFQMIPGFSFLLPRIDTITMAADWR